MNWTAESQPPNFFPENFETKTKSAKPDLSLWLATIARSQVESLKKTYHRVEYEQRKRRGLESQHTVWDVKKYMKSYFEIKTYAAQLAANDPEKNAPQVCQDIFTHMIEADFRTLFDEACGPETPTYEYSIYGLPHGYVRRLDSYGGNFVVDQQVKGGDVLRAKVEALTMTRLSDWIAQDQPRGTQLIWISPRGSGGYPGLKPKNPVMLDVYTQAEATPANPTGKTFKQYKAWTAQAELLTFQAGILKYGHLFPGNLSSDLNVPLSADLQVIDQLVELPPENGIDWETYIYAQEKTWPVHRDEYPVVNPDQFNQFRQQVFELYYQQLEPALQAATRYHQSLGDKFWSSPEYRQLLLEMDACFASCAASVFKWVEDFDLRDKKTERQDYITALKKKVKHQQRQKLSETDNLVFLQERIALEKRVLRGDALDPLAARRLKELNMAFAVTNRVFSLTQCGLMTPFSLAFKASVNFAQFETQLNGLSLEAKKDKLQELKDYVRLDLPGANQVWYVPPAYLDGLGCRVVSEGKYKGEVEGPCPDDEVPPKAERILLSDQRDTMALTEDQYLTAQKTIQKSIQNQELAKAALPPGASETQIKHFNHLSDRLQRRLFKNSISALVAGVTEFSEEALKLPTEIFSELHHSLNPLKTLEEIVISLEKGETRSAHQIEIVQTNPENTQDILETVAEV